MQYSTSHYESSHFLASDPQWASTIMHERSVPLQNIVQSAGK